MQKDIIIFGAGQIGRMALLKYRDRVDYFIDNNKKIQGEKISGITIKSVEDGIRDITKHTVVIASKYQELMAKQLRDMGVYSYSFYLQNFNAYYETEEVVINPYLDNNNRDISEEEWNDVTRRKYMIEVVNDMVEQLYSKENMFDHIEIETINRCNGNCSFCPVNRKNDPREYKVMPDLLFKRIIEQLVEINYSAKLALFSNNEPFLDPDILEKHKYVRSKLPNVRMHLFTNGTLLTLERFKEIMLYLDELIIDNYQQDLRLIKPCQEIVKYCENYPELKRKVTIVLRKPREILSTRGGDAPNRKQMISYKKDKCVLPFKQIIIRPDGKVSLCCNDPLGKNTLGDLTKENILDIWNGAYFKKVRECLYQGRENWKHCEYCDFFSLG